MAKQENTAPVIYVSSKDKREMLSTTPWRFEKFFSVYQYVSFFFTLFV